MTSSTPRSTDRSIPRADAMEFADGTRAEAAFYGDAGQAIFGVTHWPLNPTGTAVLVCSPILNDHLKNNRREILLGRLLATMGLTVHRFQYRGTANSEGEVESLELETMIADMRCARQHLREAASPDRIVYMGTRLGALPAAVGAALDESPLALWEPIEGPRFFRELFRTMAIIEMNAGDGTGAPLAELKADFERDGVMDAAGFAVSHEFYERCERPILDTIGPGQAPVFLAQFREKPELKAEYRKLVDSLADQGREVAVHHMLMEEAWMLFVYGFRPEEERQHSQELIKATADWIEGLT